MRTKETLTDADWAEVDSIRDRIRAARGAAWVHYSDECGLMSARMAVHG